MRSEALLRIEAPHFVAGAIFENRDGGWKCIKAAPIIRYLCKMSPSEIKRYLDLNGWRYTWVKQLVKVGSPPYQYRNPRIDGPVAAHDGMDHRNEWLDIIAKKSERVGLE